VHGRTLAGQVVQSGRQPFKIAAGAAVDIGIDEGGRFADQAGRTFFLDRFQQFARRVLTQKAIDVQQVLAKQPVKAVAVGREMVVAVPPEPVAPLGGVQRAADQFGRGIGRRGTALQGGRHGRAGGYGGGTCRRHQIPGQVFFGVPDPDAVIAVDP